MGASSYVGRVGGLAAALGVGVVLALGQPVAWATEPGTDSSASEHSVSEGSPNSNSPTADLSSDSAANTGTPTNAAESGDDSDNDVDENSTTTGEDAVPAGAAREDDQSADVTGEASDTAQSDTAETEGEAAESTSQGDRHSGQSAQISDTHPPTVASTVDTNTVDTTVDAGPSTFRLATLSAASTTEQPQSLTSTTETDVAPVALTTPAAPAAPPLLQQVVNLFAAVTTGLSALASNLPGAPIWSPFVMAILGLGSRREITEPVSAVVQTAAIVPTAALTLTEFATAAVMSAFPGTTRTPTAVSANTAWIDFVTGAGNLNNTIARFGIGGTDLGIMWDNGIKDNPLTTTIDENQVLIAFGDTFSSAVPVRTGVWRFNTLFRTPDDVLSNGLYVPNGVPVNHTVTTPNSAWFSGSPMEKPNWADPILPSPGDPVHPPYAVGTEVTIIPTAGISAPYNNAYGSRQYMSFMSIRSWDTPGRWTTNYSGIAYSDNNGQSWKIAPTSIRAAAGGRSTVPYISGNQNFQQGAFVKPAAGSADATAGWVYSYGTPSGRLGTLYLSRVKQDQILDTTKYQYWNGSTWTANQPSAAKPVLPGTVNSFFGLFSWTTYPSVSEMSVQYNPYLKKYVMLYGDSGNNIVMRTANSPQGTWSAPKQLVSSWTMPGLYAPYIHPWSGTANLSTTESKYLYWNLSTWNDYQVRLMRTDLTKV